MAAGMNALRMVTLFTSAGALALALGACAGPPPPEDDDDDDDATELPLRTPGTVELECTEDPFFCPDGSADVPQVDVACTLGAGGHDAIVLVQANPTSLSPFGFAIYEDVRAFVEEGGAVVEVAGGYDYGGNHHNDFADVVIGDSRFRFNHSSFGFGFRACQPPDCVQVMDAAGNVVDDGCTPDRTLPEVCVYLDGAALPEFVDTFARCAGDPNGP